MATKAKKQTPAAKTAKTETPKAKVTAAKTPAATNSDTRKIKVLVTENPKRGKSRDRFALHRTGQTVAQYIARSVKAGNPVTLAKADIRWDQAKKLIAVA